MLFSVFSHSDRIERQYLGDIEKEYPKKYNCPIYFIYAISNI